MKRGIFKFIIFWWLLAGFFVCGEEGNFAWADQDGQFWTLVTSTGGIDGTKFRYFGEVQPRYDSDGDRVERLLMRGAVGYELAPRLTGWLGYGWTPLFQNLAGEKDFTQEHRIWQQLSYNMTVGSTRLDHRLRSEQRKIGHESQYSNRLRYQLRGSRPLWMSGEKTYGLTGYNELFVNLHGMDRGPSGGFDRNRYFLGPYLEQDAMRFELGYLGEYSPLRGDDSRQIHALLFSIGFNVDL